MIRVPTHREPNHPGAMLQKEFLTPLGMTPQDLAAAIRLPPAQVEEIVQRRQSVTAAVACRLSRYFGNSPGFWLNGQRRWDLYHAQRSEAAALERIQPLDRESFPEPEERDGAAVAAEEVAAIRPS